MKGKTNAHTSSRYVPSELVTINVTADNGVLPDGFEVTITDSEGNVLITSSEATFSIKIPYNTTYTVSASDVEGYRTPTSQTLTAALITRSISIVYKELVYGVYIQDISGNLYTEDTWDGTQTANGVAVITEECSFAIALTESSSTMSIHSSYTGALESYMTAISDETQAKADYDGATNTTNIMKLQSGTGYAAGWCNAFSFPSGKTGFLPSLGQMWAAYSNKSAVDAALTKAGGTTLTSTYYWTSTFWGVNSSYRRCWVLDWSGGLVSRSTLNDASLQVRAFTSLD